MPVLRPTDAGARLLADWLTDNPPADRGSARALVLSATDPALPLVVTTLTSWTDIFDPSHTALERLRQHVQAGQIAHLAVQDTVFPAEDGLASYDIALMLVPKGREVARAQLHAALRALKPGGRLYIAGPTNGGAKSVMEDATALFGRCVTLAIRDRHRLGLATRPKSDDLPAFPADWGENPTLPQTRTYETSFGSVRVCTVPGLFSYDHLDDGTAFLLENLHIADRPRVLDIGCGCGVIGAALAPHSERVLMIDDDLRAIRCTRETIQLNALANAEAQPGDVYAGLDGQRFDLIVSNPPFHKDFDVNTNVAHRIIRGATDHLNPGGRLVIVANAFLGYEKVLAEHLSRARALARNNRYVVIEGSV